MENENKIKKNIVTALLPFGFAVLIFTVYAFPAAKIDLGLVSLSIVTVFFSSRLQIQLPRTKIHLTVADAMIMLSLLLYGGSVAVLLAACESLFVSLNFKRKGIPIKFRTALFNINTAVLSTFLAAQSAGFLFGSVENVVSHGSAAMLIALVSVAAIVQFVVNSVCVSIFVASRSEKTVWSVWHENCLNTLVMCFTGAIVAGGAVRALEPNNIFFFALTVGFFAVAYMTYRRYVNDVKETSAQAEQAERKRAEQAERHVEELKHHLSEQERISVALRESKEKFRRAAFQDALTDLPNRNRFTQVLEYTLEAMRSDHKLRFAVLYLDLAQFRTINESLGHSTGDRLLQNVGKRLQSLVGERDLLARFGGDEFGILLTRIDDLRQAVEFAELIEQKLSEPFAADGRRIFVGANIGIATGNFSAVSVEEVLRDADIAMYRAKEQKKPFEVFDSAMHERVAARLQTETDLRYALERGEFEPYFQPIFALDSLRPAGFETLIRWNHPEKGLVMPGDFIGVCEDTGLIVPVTYFVLEQSCRRLAEWQQINPDESLFISVNISGKHFMYGDAVDQIRRIIAETGIAPQNLKLEITESAVMEDAEKAIEMLGELKKAGVRLSIDDFGTGYSSLSYLHRFPVDTLKIDRSFVSSLEDLTENDAIVRAIVGLAKTLDMEVVAEGIETLYQFRRLRLIGCEYGQGFLMSKPVPADKIRRLIADKSDLRELIPNFELTDGNTLYQDKFMTIG